MTETVRRMHAVGTDGGFNFIAKPLSYPSKQALLIMGRAAAGGLEAVLLQPAIWQFSASLYVPSKCLITDRK